jgi:hypothetical protein
VKPKAANLRSSTVQTLLSHANSCITLVTPSFKTTFCCRSVILVKGQSLISRGKAAGQVCGTHTFMCMMCTADELMHGEVLVRAWSLHLLGTLVAKKEYGS